MRTLAQKSKATQEITSAKSTIPVQTYSGQTRKVPPFNRLKPLVESQAVQELLEGYTRDVKGDLTATETARFDYDFSRIPLFAPDRIGRSQTPSRFIQAKLVIGQVDDPLERAADRIADQVMLPKVPDLSIADAPTYVGRKGITGEGKDSKTLQTTQPDPRALDSGIPTEARALQGGGSPLPRSRRAFFESRFGYDFSGVRIHSDTSAARLAQGVNARAFTLGQDIVLGAGQYSLETGEGTRLLAHELAHVVQQQTSPAFIQRQPAKEDPFAPGGVYDQLSIVREATLPLELFRRPEIRRLSFSEVQTLRFQRKLKAINELGDLRDERAVLTLVAVVEDKLFVAPKDFTPQQKLLLQQEAVAALGKIGGSVALSKLSDLLNSKDPKQRLMAARGLSGAAGGQAVTVLLAKLKQETDGDIKSQIIFALGNVGSGLSSNQEKQLIVTELIREMENNTGVVQSAAIRALGRIRLKSATEPLLKQLKLWTSIPALTQDIIWALGEIGDDRAVELLAIMLEKHGEKSVRSQAAIALGKIGGAKALAALKQRLTEEKDADVKVTISKALP
jgi:HEAT repeat protein